MTPNESSRLVSVILPFLNGGPAFEMAVLSILQQTHRDLELLLCDDGSTDGSLELARTIKDPRVVVWSDGQTKGLAARLNECIDRARGSYIARMDADDVSYPDRIERQVAFLECHPNIDVVGCRMLIFEEDGKPLGKRQLPLEHEDIVANPASGFGLAHPTWLAHAEWFRRYRYDPAAVRFEDVELLYRACKSSRFANLPEVLYGYRELQGGFRKRYQTRHGRIRYLKARAKQFGHAFVIRAAVGTAFKTAADAVLASTSTRFIMLRHRAEPLDADELRQWHTVLETTRNTRSSPRAVGHEPLRIVVIATVAETLADFFPKQLRTLADEGFEVHAVSSPGPMWDGMELGPLVKRHAIAMKRRPSPIHDVRSFLRLFRLMREVRPHIVHAHTPKAGLLGMAAARAAGIPVRLYTVHGLPLLTRTGLWRRVLEAAERASASLSTRTYTVGPSLQKSLVDLKLCPESKICMLGHGSCAGVDLDRFQPVDAAVHRVSVRTNYGIPLEAPLATYIGRISRDKGIAVLAGAWPELAQQVSNLHLLIAGELDVTDLAPQSALKILESDPRIHCVGFVPMPNVPALYSASDMIVLPTFREGLSQVALESGAMGVPIVSTRDCGVDAVIDGVTGILVPARNSEALGEAIRKLATDSGLRARLGSAAKVHIAQCYSDQRVNQLWMAEYRSLVQEWFPESAGSAVQVGS